MHPATWTQISIAYPMTIRTPHKHAAKHMPTQQRDAISEPACRSEPRPAMDSLQSCSTATRKQQNFATWSRTGKDTAKSSRHVTSSNDCNQLVDYMNQTCHSVFTSHIQQEIQKPNNPQNQKVDGESRIYIYIT